MIRTKSVFYKLKISLICVRHFFRSSFVIRIAAIESISFVIIDHLFAS